jgi:alpha-glucoside transport system permease protein
MDSRIITALEVVLVVPAVLVGYIWATERLLSLAQGKWRERIRPWLWLTPALILLTAFLIVPTLQTIWYSFHNKDGSQWRGLDNYAWFLNGSGLASLVNNILWVVLLTAGTIVIGLAVAVLADRVRYESLAKSILFMPMAISGVCAAVIWKFMYWYQNPGTPQTGLLNEGLTKVGQAPIPFLVDSDYKIATFALIFIMIWMWTGFGTVILSASLKSISPELLEAARVDGATEWQVFRKITFPLLSSTIAVVSTTMIITGLKAFDLVYTLTANGSYDTQTIANEMYNQYFNFGQYGRGSAVAVVLLLAIIPVMLFNIRRFQFQEGIR